MSNFNSQYEKLKTAKFLWSLFINLRKQIPDKHINDNTIYIVKIQGIYLNMIRLKSKKYYKQTEQIQNILREGE